MTAFLRTNRYASVLITTIILVVVGLIVNFLRDDSPSDNGVVLRADEQTLQTQPSVTLPENLTDRAFADAPATGPNLTIAPIGKIPQRPHANKSGATTATTTRGSGPTGGTRTSTTVTTPAAGGDEPSTPTPPVASNAFAQGRIVYTASGTLWTVNPDGSDRRGLGVSGYFPAWSEDHSAIAYADADNPGGALYMLAPNGTKTGLTTGVVDDAQPTWSPDGTKLAFARIDTTAQTDNSAIWMINRDGSNLHKISAPSPCFSRDPAWSPDGKKIAFWSSRDHCGGGASQGNYELYVYDVATDQTTRLDPEHVSNAGAPAWSPDGKTIAYACDGEGGVGFEICKIGSTGASKVRITNATGDDTDPSWSPDGKQIVFRSDRNGGGIFVMNADGSSPVQLVAGGAQPNWN